MIGVFPKDIWGIIFEKLETNFNPHTLNNLSVTCKRLYGIDKQRRQNYIKSYEKIGPLIEKLKKGRQDYVNIVKYAPITCHFYKYYYFPINSNLIKDWLKNHSGIDHKEKERLLNMKEKEMLTKFVKFINTNYYATGEIFAKDIEMISRQILAPPFFYVLSYLKNRGDIVNTIMDLQFFDDDQYFECDG